jgi:hypothetical protein
MTKLETSSFCLLFHFRPIHFLWPISRGQKRLSVMKVLLVISANIRDNKVAKRLMEYTRNYVREQMATA